MDIVRSLNNDDKENIGKQINALTHFDPALYLPTELFLQTLAYLEPEDIRNASTVSRAWRERAFDERLWQLSFAREGWVLDTDATAEVEKQAARHGKQRAVAHLMSGTPLERRESRKRRRTEAFNDRDSSSGSGEVTGAVPLDGQHGSVHPLAETVAEEMEGLETSGGVPVGRPSMDEDLSFTDIEQPELLRIGSSPNHQILRVRSPLDFKDFPKVFQASRPNSPPKLSWLWLYKQRRRLEWNWDNKKCKSFQLPHPDHLEEGHTECVYTIQHTARHLVSGSRDRTIRIWDLHTNRLKQLPLQGHDASVLCLQFDERPEQDIIVSGGSDSSVIIWKFSTGEMIKHLYEAHDESVLNLRFDDRYIVTCSKDKTIKVWNRRALARDSPLIPDAVINVFTNPIPGTPGGTNLLIPPFTPLNTIKGHAAAVNAVMIHNDTIVSASGDRTVKAWNINTGKAVKNYAGHTKGIACVQFDGRRVVSGSSDNTVRIFDAEEAAEVACLTGHKYLVRTVQARFGDLRTTTNEELAAEASDADNGFRRAVARGMQPGASLRRSQMRAAGSSRPEDMISLGAKIPPGGGGTRWARIVSGSYDETVIVWKKESDGSWAEKYSLNQAEVLARSAATRRRAPAQPTVLQNAQAHIVQAAAAQAAAHTTHNVHTVVQQAAATNGQLVAINNALAQAGQAPLNPPQITVAHHLAMQQHQQNAGHAGHPVANAAAAAAGAGNQNQQPRETHRLFKLQFDARRIICCSQNKTIVGYDFANGDAELERVGDWCLETA